MKHAFSLGLLVLLGLAVACQSTSATPILSPLTPAPSPMPSPASDREAILALMAAEAEAAVHDDADRLLELWTADGIVRDASHTPDDLMDDHTWSGHDGILSRYFTIVFPLHLTQLARTMSRTVLSPCVGWPKDAKSCVPTKQFNAFPMAPASRGCSWW